MRSPVLGAIAEKHAALRGEVPERCPRCGEAKLSEEIWPEGLCTDCHDEVIEEGHEA